MTTESLFETGLAPVRNQVLLKRLKMEDSKTPAGIILLGDWKSKSIEAWVIAAGPGRRSPKDGHLIPTAVKVGDRVLINALAGSNIGIRGRDMVIMADSDVIALVTDDR